MAIVKSNRYNSTCIGTAVVAYCVVVYRAYKDTAGNGWRVVNEYMTGMIHHAAACALRPIYLCMEGYNRRVVGVAAAPVSVYRLMLEGLANAAYSRLPAGFTWPYVMLACWVRRKR